MVFLEYFTSRHCAWRAGGIRYFLLDFGKLCGDKYKEKMEYAREKEANLTKILHKFMIEDQWSPLYEDVMPTDIAV